jgi:hypothetical protein
MEQNNDPLQQTIADLLFESERVAFENNILFFSALPAVKPW